MHGVGRPITTQPLLYPPCYDTCGIPYCMHYDNQLANCNARCSREDAHGQSWSHRDEANESSKLTLRFF